MRRFRTDRIDTCLFWLAPKTFQTCIAMDSQKRIKPSGNGEKMFIFTFQLTHPVQLLYTHTCFKIFKISHNLPFQL